VLGNTRIAPSKSVITLPPCPMGLDGTEVLGSGNWEIPCWCMHSAILSSFASVCADGCVVEPGPGGPPPGINFPHFACAALNAGDETVPALAWKAKPPPAVGSGKLGTPFERMHLANASAPGGPELGAVEAAPGASPPVAVDEPGLDTDPHAASTTEQPTTASRVADFARPPAALDAAADIWSICRTDRTFDVVLRPGR
jgi:hypothetical protein